MKKLTLNATWQVCRKTLVPAACAAALSTLAGAQGFGNEWVEFDQDNSKLVAGNSVGLGDTEEKDYMQGDLDNDGWTDLVCVRKQPFTTSGRRTNVLFMNEGGTLVDRTSQYATASTVGGDQGFLTTTNDRDVVIVDLDLDGCLHDLDLRAAQARLASAGLHEPGQQRQRQLARPALREQSLPAARPVQRQPVVPHVLLGRCG